MEYWFFLLLIIGSNPGSSPGISPNSINLIINKQKLENMSISDILKTNLSKETRARIIKLAQYFYLTNRISHGCFLYIITKPFY